jgi:tetratricopeptide (TPR) repeat protein
MPLSQMWRRGLAQWRVRWRVRWHLLLQQPERAVGQLDARLLALPDDGWALGTRCVLHQRAGRRRAALLDAQALVGLASPAPAAAWFNLGFLLEADGQWDAACAAFEQATRLQPTLDTAWYGLGLAHMRAGRLDQAVTPLQHCTTLQPFSPHAWYQLARLQAERGEVGAVAQVIDHLQDFEPRVAARLRQEIAGAGGGPR